MRVILDILCKPLPASAPIAPWIPGVYRKLPTADKTESVIQQLDMNQVAAIVKVHHDNLHYLAIPYLYLNPNRVFQRSTLKTANFPNRDFHSASITNSDQHKGQAPTIVYRNLGHIGACFSGMRLSPIKGYKPQLPKADNAGARRESTALLAQRLETLAAIQRDALQDCAAYLTKLVDTNDVGLEESKRLLSRVKGVIDKELDDIQATELEIRIEELQKRAEALAQRAFLAMRAVEAEVCFLRSKKADNDESRERRAKWLETLRDSQGPWARQRKAKPSLLEGEAPAARGQLPHGNGARAKRGGAGSDG